MEKIEVKKIKAKPVIKEAGGIYVLFNAEDILADDWEVREE